MTSPGLVPLSKLLRRMFFSFALAVLGSWGLIIPRLNVVAPESLGLGPSFWLYLDVASLALAILGVFMALYYKHLMDPRLKRLGDLGESRW